MQSQTAEIIESYNYFL